MGNNNPETIVGRSIKDEEQFRAGFTSKHGGARSSDPFGRILTQNRRDERDGCVPLAAPPVEFQDAIGKELRNLYDDVAAQPVPDRFLDLLNQLEGNVLHSARSPRAPGEDE